MRQVSVSPRLAPGSEKVTLAAYAVPATPVPGTDFGATLGATLVTLTTASAELETPPALVTTIVISKALGRPKVWLGPWQVEPVTTPASGPVPSP